MLDRRTGILLIVSWLLIGVGGAVSLPVHTQADWDAGTFTNTTAVNGALELVGTNATGSYVSQVFDAGDEYAWDDLVVSSTLNGGGASVTVETSDDDFSSVLERDTFALSGGTETFNMSPLQDSRYVRFNYSLTRGSDTPSVDGTNVTLEDGVHFIIRDDACQLDERELFSLSDRTNAHAANPGHYEDYRVCGSGIDQSDYDQVCTDVETPSLSFFGSNQNYTHLSTDSDLFDYKLCTGQLSIGIRKSCPDTTKNIASIYELPESHVAEPGFYEQQLCGAIFKEVSLMMQFHLGDNDTVYMNGTEDPVTGVYRNEDGWLSSYISAQNTSLVSGIVSGEYTLTTGIGYGEQGNDHVFNVTQDRNAEISYFIPFTEGSRFSIEGRLGMIERGAFLKQVNPSFGYRLAEQALIRLTLELTQIDLVSDMVLSSGIHRLVITNMGTNAAGEPEVAVNVTAP